MIYLIALLSLLSLTYLAALGLYKRATKPKKVSFYLTFSEKEGWKYYEDQYDAFDLFDNNFSRIEKVTVYLKRDGSYIEEGTKSVLLK